MKPRARSRDLVRVRTLAFSLGLSALALSAAAGGCNFIAGLDDYAVGKDDTVDGAPVRVDAATHDDARVITPSDDATIAADCGSAPPQAIFTAGCTNATCVPFDDDAHILDGLLEGGALPPLPEAGSGTTTTTDAGPKDAAAASEAGGDDAGSPYPPCSSLPNPVYMMGSNALLPIVQQLGTWANDEGITLIYTQLSSCKGVSAVVQNVDAITAGATISNYWDTGSDTLTCTIDAASKFADVGLSSVFMQTCLPTTTGFSGVADFQGPVVTSVWFVPSSSTQTAISAEAAYLLYSGAGSVAPWTDKKYVFLRGATGGTQVMMGDAFGVPAAQWVGTTTGSSDLERSDVIGSTAPAQTLGLGEIDYAEDAVGVVNLHELAYRHYGQSCAYYPNLTATSHDKLNVRNGRYAGWGPVHLISRVNAQGVPVNTSAGQLINYFIGNEAIPNHDFLSLVIEGHLVPQCAMNVHRTAEVGIPAPYEPAPSCACFFDSKVNTTSCQTCATNADCPVSNPACNLGYCEPR